MRYSANSEVNAKPYNYGFDLLKLLLSLAIVCLHVNWQIIPHGYLAVEVFFILSGYFFIRSGNYKNKIPTIYLNLLNKTYAKYAFSLALFFLVQLPLTYSSWDYFVAFSMLQGTSLKDGLMNPPTWFLCVLIWTLPLFSLVKIINKKTQIIFLSSLVISSYFILFISSPSGGINAVFEFSAGSITAAQMRCVGGLALGCLLGIANIQIKDSKLSILFTTISILLSLLLMEGAINNPKSDFLILITSVLLIYSIDSFHLRMPKTFAQLVKKHSPTITVSIFLYHYPIFLLIERLIPGNSYVIKICLITICAATIGVVMKAGFVAIKKAGFPPLLSSQFRKSKI
jgi:peptidoglycan/LPS O-acetylase OafA/YrhL